ncbi:MAG: primosomal protein N' [Bdellovibrionaceae bacterium]|nr:primosomal protein N' [Pseudobdellovibrionaceae bacterium]
MNQIQPRRRYYELAVNAPISKTFTYHYDSEQVLSPGLMVKAPFGSRKVNAVILKEVPSQDIDFTTKSIDVDLEAPVMLSTPMLQWGKWLSEYYVYPLGQVLNHFFPTVKRKERAPSAKPSSTETPLNLTDEQQTVFDSIYKQINSFNVHLVHGITGSGKTEIYLQLIDKVMAEGKQALVLVPEISLTPQLEDRFKRRFGESQVAVVHSQITPRKKTDAWYDISEHNKSILIGARSALFSNFKNLGIIIVDEEHDSSFKQDEKLKYNGKDAAIMLAKLLNLPIILGSATPSLESWNQALEKKFQLHTLKDRVFKQAMPKVEILDLRQSEAYPGQEFWYTKALHEKITKHLNNDHQVALFLNRRGLAQTIQCLDCGQKLDCPNCDISLTLHHKHDLLCHYCGYHEKKPLRCPHCQSEKLLDLGLGTEKVQNVLQELFPEKKIVRADRDSIENRADMEEFIKTAEAHEAHILIGTQMIAKGLDFPKLAFVGVILADVGLNIPDFRASERVFQLITQVSGRAGRRKELDGEVLVQSFSPEHSVFKWAQESSFEGFSQEELTERNLFLYPPFSRLSCLRVQTAEKETGLLACQWVSQKIEALKQKHPEYTTLEILGPTPAPIQKIKNQYRHLFLLKSSKPLLAQKLFAQLTHTSDGLPAKTKLSLDVDPLNML